MKPAKIEMMTNRHAMKLEARYELIFTMLDLLTAGSMVTWHWITWNGEKGFV